MEQAKISHETHSGYSASEHENDSTSNVKATSTEFRTIVEQISVRGGSSQQHQSIPRAYQLPSIDMQLGQYSARESRPSSYSSSEYSDTPSLKLEWRATPSVEITPAHDQRTSIDTPLHCTINAKRPLYATSVGSSAYSSPMGNSRDDTNRSITNSLALSSSSISLLQGSRNVGRFLKTEDPIRHSISDMSNTSEMKNQERECMAIFEALGVHDDSWNTQADVYEESAAQPLTGTASRSRSTSNTLIDAWLSRKSTTSPPRSSENYSGPTQAPDEEPDPSPKSDNVISLTPHRSISPSESSEEEVFIVTRDFTRVAQEVNRRLTHVEPSSEEPKQKNSGMKRKAASLWNRIFKGHE
jgi:hypothetical protein